MGTLGVGIVGTGSIGQVHIDTYNGIDEYEIAAVCDIDEKALEAGVASSGAKGLSDYRKLVERKDVDVVAVCTPNDLHAPVAIAALEAGKHVFVEKPMAYNADQARDVIAARDRSGKFVQIGVCQRFRGDAQVLKEYVTGGELGNIYFAKCGYLRRSGIPGYGSWFTTMERSGGGPIVDLGVHALDLTMWLMDNFEPVSVSASAYSKLGPQGIGKGDWGTPVEGGPFDVEDLAAALIRFSNGATVFLEASWAAHLGMGSFYSQLVGEKAGLVLDPPTIFSIERGQEIDKKLSAPTVDPMAAEHQHFHDCIVNGKEPMPSAEQGLAVQAVLDAVRASAKSGNSEPVVI
jgi:predicted dehydrogenase